MIEKKRIEKIETKQEAAPQTQEAAEPLLQPLPTFVSGHLVDVHTQEIYPAKVTIEGGRIQDIERLENAPHHFILPGFVDAHIHIESSMLVPTEFAKIALCHGTVATVSDPHEIANVCGIAGVDYMVRNAEKSPLKFFFGAPSCVPATPFETAGAAIDSEAVGRLLERPEIQYLSEMMNFPGVLSGDPEVLAKLAHAKRLGKPVDGHAPGLRGKQAEEYAAHGISTDHECVDAEEALDKINAGMYILIREGSAAKNFDALLPLFRDHPRKLMFCSDDKHPDDLLAGHINQLVARAVAAGYPLFDVLHAACVLPVQHYRLDVGLLQVGAPADFIVVPDLNEFVPIQTYVDGQLVALEGEALFQTEAEQPINHFTAKMKTPDQFYLRAEKEADKLQVRAIVALDGQIVTRSEIVELAVQNGVVLADPAADLLYIGVVNRYQSEGDTAIGVVKNFGLKKGAIASSVAHDSHNLVFVGCDPASICAAVNALVTSKGGISVCSGEVTESMALPVAGLMSTDPAPIVAERYQELDRLAKELGSSLTAPFMTLSFMALPVIPELKMTDKGLFDVGLFSFVDWKVD